METPSTSPPPLDQPGAEYKERLWRNYAYYSYLYEFIFLYLEVVIAGPVPAIRRTAGSDAAGYPRGQNVPGTPHRSCVPMDRRNKSGDDNLWLVSRCLRRLLGRPLHRTPREGETRRSPRPIATGPFHMLLARREQSANRFELRDALSLRLNR